VKLALAIDARFSGSAELDGFDFWFNIVTP